MRVHITVHNYPTQYRCVQHRTVLIIFPLILQTVIIAQMLEEGTATATTLFNALVQLHERCRTADDEVAIHYTVT